MRPTWPVWVRSETTGRVGTPTFRSFMWAAWSLADVVAKQLRPATFLAIKPQRSKCIKPDQAKRVKPADFYWICCRRPSLPMTYHIRLILTAIKRCLFTISEMTGLNSGAYLSCPLMEKLKPMWCFWFLMHLFLMAWLPEFKIFLLEWVHDGVQDLSFQWVMLMFYFS